jgi:hypothetical protein
MNGTETFSRSHTNLNTTKNSKVLTELSCNQAVYEQAGVKILFLKFLLIFKECIIFIIFTMVGQNCVINHTDGLIVHISMKQNAKGVINIY